MVACTISIRWWDLIRSKQLSSGSVCHTQCLLYFLFMVIQIIIDSGLCVYHLFGCWNIILPKSKWITFPTQFYLFLYSFCPFLLHPIIMWLTVLSQSLHSQHLLFFGQSSIFVMIWLVVVVLLLLLLIIIIIIIIVIIIIVYSLEFFTSALADGLSLEFEWQQVSSSLQDSSQYSGRSQ